METYLDKLKARDIENKEKSKFLKNNEKRFYAFAFISIFICIISIIFIRTYILLHRLIIPKEIFSIFFVTPFLICCITSFIAFIKLLVNTYKTLKKHAEFFMNYELLSIILSIILFIFFGMSLYFLLFFLPFRSLMIENGAIYIEITRLIALFIMLFLIFLGTYYKIKKDLYFLVFIILLALFSYINESGFKWEFYATLFVLYEHLSSDKLFIKYKLKRKKKVNEKYLELKMKGTKLGVYISLIMFFLFQMLFNYIINCIRFFNTELYNNIINSRVYINIIFIFFYVIFVLGFLFRSKKVITFLNKMLEKIILELNKFN